MEVDALEPDDLHRLFDTALARWWNPAANEAILEAEDHDRDQLNAQ
ncbi:hypothetical protein [Saccharopolyspora sp. ASAGF58]|nr:hypothetical protein [Saccharopolyspora sp. ASAGF58]